jgi:hypothetical protein
MIARFLVKLEISSDIMEKHQYLINSEGDQLFKPVANAETGQPE